MNYRYINLKNPQDLIEGVILRKLVIHNDATGSLVETLRKDWRDVFNETDLNFVMQYVSITPPGTIRDEDKWHLHQLQKDRFICVSGRIVTAVFDPREDSRTKNKLNLFIMGPGSEAEMFMLVIPQQTCHGFGVISKEPGHLLNFPTRLYDPDDEGRVENSQLDWNKVRADFAIGNFAPK